MDTNYGGVGKAEIGGSGCTTQHSLIGVFNKLLMLCSLCPLLDTKNSKIHKTQSCLQGACSSAILKFHMPDVRRILPTRI